MVSIDKKISQYIEDNQETFYGIRPDGSTLDSVKWYSWENDMKKLSKKFPSVLFEMSGEGEENEDIWRAYFVNGKFHTVKATIVFEEFDMEKLQ